MENAKVPTPPERESHVEFGAVWCNRQKSCATASYDGRVDIKVFPEGQKYIVADLGGGTADLSVHEILPDRNLREIRRADGGAYGGTAVDDAFFQLLSDIFGTNVITHIRETAYNEIMDLRALFQIRKCRFNPLKDDENKKYVIRMPTTVIQDAIKELGDENSMEYKMEEAKKKFKGKVSFESSKFNLVLNRAAMEELFETTVDGIVRFITEIRKEDELGEINMIMLVGGLSSSPYIQNIVKTKIRGLRIFVPVDPSLAVVKGAVLMGHKPKTITEKIARYTYGLSVVRDFREGEDPEYLKKVQEGRVVCTASFAKLVEKGATYKPGDEFGEITIGHVVRGLISMFGTLMTSVYRSEEANPEYADEEHGCEVGAVIEMPHPAGGWPPISMFQPKMVLGLSEITVEVYDRNRRETLESRLEFI